MPNETNEKLLAKKAVALLSAGRHEEAAEKLRNVCARQNVSPEHWFIFGSALANLRDKTGAAHAFRKALETGPDSLRIFDSFIRVLISREGYEQVLEPLRLYLSLRPDHYIAKLRFITALTRLRRFSEAHQLCEELNQIQPDNIELMFQMAEIYMLRGCVNEAIQLFNEILTKNPASVAALMNKGLALKSSGNIDAAIDQFMRVTSLSPNLDSAWYSLGLSLLCKPDNEKALECFVKAFQINPGNIHAGDQLARMYRLFGRIDEAMRIYEMILKVHPENVRARFYLNAYSDDALPSRIPPEVIGLVYAKKDAGRNFDQALVKSMDYRTPDILNSAVRKVVHVPDKGLDIMELGCGSGLCGSKLSDIAHRLIGTDLSKSMLESAREKNVYDELYEADLVDVLSSNAAAFDLVIATDVLCFFGDLTDIFGMCYKTLRKYGVFGFSVEKPKSDELFALNPEGYFYHSLTHLRAAASETGFEEAYVKETVLRTEQDTKRVGYICLFKRK
ncbi:MAG TPA: tetratricopeptide repeat protein [Gammaproteobacteria bacterium]|nr:tetratricopeptide repeat protein [Gammaproteobacteria bacterium]